MSLSLKIISQHGEPLSDTPACTIDAGGGSIGRNPDSSLCLQDAERIVSSKHAEVFFQGGQYFITDTSTNGLFVNSAASPLGRGNSVRIQHNDRFGVGPYVIAAEVDAPAAEIPAVQGREAPPAQLGPDLGMEAPPRDPLADFGGGGATTGADAVPGGDGRSAIGPDPFSVLGGAEEFRDSGGDDFCAVGPPLIPDDYHLLGGDTGGNPAQTGPTGGDATPILSSHVSLARPLEDRPAPRQIVDPDWNGATPPSAPTPVAGPVPLVAEQMPRISSAADTAGRVAARDGFAQVALEAAGLGDLDLDDETLTAVAQNMGATLRELVQGVIDILAERSKFKSEFRLDVTRLRPDENNPLKFPQGVEECLMALLTGTPAGLMSGPDAVREAFGDLKGHQISVMAGITASLSSLLARLDPAEIQAHAAGNGVIDSLVPGNRQARYWEQYVRAYEDVADDAAEGFRRLLTEQFAAAYDAQERRLRQVRRS